eukprot:3936472-Rhodomonas_salina.4
MSQVELARTKLTETEQQFEVFVHLRNHPRVKLVLMYMLHPLRHDTITVCFGRSEGGHQVKWNFNEWREFAHEHNI